MSNIPGWNNNHIPSVDVMYAEINIVNNEYYEVGGISDYNVDPNTYQVLPYFTGSLNKIANDIVKIWLRKNNNFQYCTLSVWPLIITFNSQVEIKFIEYAVPSSRDRKVDFNKFLIDLTAELQPLADRYVKLKAFW